MKISEMSIDDCIHKLDFSIGAYQKLIDENVTNGEVVGTGVRGTWTASTPLNKAYSDMIEALQIAKATMHKYEKIQEIMKSKEMNAFNIGLLIPKDMACVLHEIKEVIENGNNNTN